MEISHLKDINKDLEREIKSLNENIKQKDMQINLLEESKKLISMEHQANLEKFTFK